MNVLTRSCLAPPAVLCALAAGCLASGVDKDPRRESRFAVGEVPLYFMAGGVGRYVAQGRGIRADFDLGEVRITSRAGNLLVRFPGANPTSDVAPLKQQSGRINFVGGGLEGRTNIATYAGVIYHNLYPGIDLVYRAKGANLKYEFVVAPGANPAVIRVAYSGTASVLVDSNGDLVARTALGEYRESELAIYQESGETRIPVVGAFQIAEAEGPDRTGFTLGPYDRSRALIIDPTISFSTYFGGSQFTAATSVALDGAGNIYLAGWTESPNLSVRNAAQSVSGGGVDAFVAKLNSTGSTLLYCTYLGGSGDDRALGIAVDPVGSAYITGWSTSANFPITNQALQRTMGGGRDAFVARLSVAGDLLLYSTYLGGSGYEAGRAIVVDAAGNAYVAGETTSGNFPTARPLRAFSGGQQDAFVAELNGTGTALLFSTYLGGAADDGATAIALGGSGNVYVTGATSSTDFPTAGALQSMSGGNQDAFVTKLNVVTGALIYSTYLGGSGGTTGLPEYGAAIDVDAAGNAYVAGVTSSPNFPVYGAFQANRQGSVDGFVTKLNPAGSGIVFSTYLGGTSIDMATGVRVDFTTSACVVGYTASPDFPLMQPLQSSPGGGYDAFVSCLTPDGSMLRFSTYLGGSGSDTANAIAVDGSSVYVTGQTTSSNFPTQSALQNSNLGGYGGFIIKLQPDLGPKANLWNPSPGSVLFSSTVTFSWTSSSGAAGYWLSVGTLPGQGDFFAANVGSATSQTISGIPMTGIPIYVRLSTLLAGTWQYTDYHYYTPSKAVMLSPMPGTVLSSSTITLSWAAGSGASAYWLDVGTVQGQGNIFAANLGSNTSQTIAGIPSTASTYYVRLWTLIAGVWQYYDYTYATPSKASISTPVPGSTLTGSATTITWSSSNAAAYWLDVGTAQGQGTIFGANVGTNTAQAVSGIPTNGAIIFVRLWSLLWGIWQYTDYSYTAAAPTKGVMITPPPNTVLNGPAATFTWSSSGATAYWLDVGTIKGQGNIFAANLGAATSQPVSGLPTSGITLYVRLWSFISAWVYNDYVYTAATFQKAVMTAPTPGTTLGSTTLFSWTAANGATAYWLDVGTLQGRGNIFAANLGTETSHTVTSLATGGVTLWVRLWSLIAGNWLYTDYIYNGPT